MVMFHSHVSLPEDTQKNPVAIHGYTLDLFRTHNHQQPTRARHNRMDIFSAGIKMVNKMCPQAAFNQDGLPPPPQSNNMWPPGEDETW
jgi:hypothetical protein